MKLNINKNFMDERLEFARWGKFQLKVIREDLKQKCKNCIKKKKDTCNAGERNHCEIRQYYIEITKLLNNDE